MVEDYPDSFLNSSSNITDESTHVTDTTNKILNSTYTVPPSGYTAPPENIGGKQHKQRARRVTCKEIQSIATEIFERSKDYRPRGLKAEDLIKGEYKRVDTRKQAQRLINYHVNKKNLYARSPMAMPQEYFATSTHADLALIYTVPRVSYPKPPKHTHTKTPKTPLQEKRALEEREGLIAQLAYERDMQTSKSNDFLERLAIGLNSVGEDYALLDWEAHNIRIEVPMPVNVYNYESISKIPIRDNNNKDRVISPIIRGYQVRIRIFPKSNDIEIRIAVSDRQPFLLHTEDPTVTTSRLTTFAAEIRRSLCLLVGDLNDRIVPPVERWLLKQMDINLDMRANVTAYFNEGGMQLPHVDDMILATYNKLRKKKYYSSSNNSNNRGRSRREAEVLKEAEQENVYQRIESREHQFQEGAGIPINKDLGPHISEEVGRFHKKLRKVVKETVKDMEEMRRGEGGEGEYNDNNDNTFHIAEN